ncbi:MAG: hypothetical protein AB1847_00805 [bacterium]
MNLIGNEYSYLKPVVRPVVADEREIRSQSPSVATRSARPGQSVNSSQVSAQRVQPQKAEIEQVCNEFASIFFQTLLKSMYSTVPKSSACPELQGKDLINSIVDKGVAQFMAREGAGLKELLLGKLLNEKK